MQNSITELLSTLLREALGKAGLPVPDDVLWEMLCRNALASYL